MWVMDKDNVSYTVDYVSYTVDNVSYTVDYVGDGQRLRSYGTERTDVCSWSVQNI